MADKSSKSTILEYPRYVWLLFEQLIHNLSTIYQLLRSSGIHAIAVCRCFAAQKWANTLSGSHNVVYLDCIYLILSLNNYIYHIYLSFKFNDCKNHSKCGIKKYKSCFFVFICFVFVFNITQGKVIQLICNIFIYI